MCKKNLSLLLFQVKTFRNERITFGCTHISYLRSVKPTKKGKHTYSINHIAVSVC